MAMGPKGSVVQEVHRALGFPEDEARVTLPPERGTSPGNSSLQR